LFSDFYSVLPLVSEKSEFAFFIALTEPYLDALLLPGFCETAA
jgi:hypothetical protein